MPSKLKKWKALELSRALKIKQALNIYRPVVCIRRVSLGNVENKELEHIFLENIVASSWKRMDDYKTISRSKSK